MAKVGRMRAAAAAGNKARRYGSTRSHSSSVNSERDMLGSSFRSLDTVKSELQEDGEFSCWDCCKATPGCLYNFTVESCIHRCKKPVPEEEPLTPRSMDDLDMEINNMKRLLKFRFMNPFQKWRYSARRRFPWKFVLQLISIILVTTQLAMFANSKFALTDFLQANKLTFAQLFVIKPVDPNFSNPVPTPIRVIYTNEDLFEQLNFTASQYFNLEHVAVAPYGYQWEGPNDSIVPHLHLKIRKHAYGDINPTKKTYEVSSDIVTDRHKICNTTIKALNCSSLTDLNWSEIERELPWILSFHLDFTVSSIYIPNDMVKCFQFNISLEIKNDLEKGNMPVDMSMETTMSGCDNSSDGGIDVDTGVLSDARSTVVDSLVIFISILTIILCAISLIKSYLLSKVVRNFFVKHFDWKLKAKHLVPLFNLWFVGIIVSNVLVLVGSIMKLIIAYTNPDSIALVDITSIILGLAVFGQWCGLLRFLSYFDKYNMLLITLRLSMPSVLRFGVCAGILYISFLLLGWLVLGPYHPKFRDPSTTSECLFSLLNGDDMFATYLETSQVSTATWIFSKVYLYIFISLFIYVVLSVFISLISDTYETLHDHWGNRTRGLLQDFATDQLGRGRLRSGSHHSNHSMVEEDTEDYNLLRGIAVSSEHQPLIDKQPPPLVDIQGQLQPHPFPGPHSINSKASSKT